LFRFPFRLTAAAALCAAVAAPASAVVFAQSGVVGAVRNTDPIRAESATGPVSRGVNDFQPDAASAEADTAAGVLRAFARDGGTFGAAAAGGQANIDETITITGAPGAGGLATYSLLADANIDTLSILTGGPVGGSTFASFDASATILALFPSRSILSRGSVLHQSGHSFRLNRNNQIEATQNGPFLQTTPTIQNFGPTLPNPVQDVRFDVIANAISTVEVLIALDFLVNPGDRFRLISDIRAQASGAPGHGAAVIALNTARMGLTLPEGLGFTSESGVFLSQAAPLGPTPAPIPLPPSAALLLAGLSALALRRRL
jgi:hypothetical protein